MTAGPNDRFAVHDEPPESEPTGPEALRQLREEAERFGELVRLYLAARIDAIKVALRRTAMGLAAAAVGLLVAVSLLVTAVVVLVLGISESIGVALGERYWAGNLITGAGLLVIVAVTLFVVMKWTDRKFRERTVAKYERRRKQQRTHLGQNAGQRKSAPGEVRK